VEQLEGAPAQLPEIDSRGLVNDLDLPVHEGREWSEIVARYLTLIFMNRGFFFRTAACALVAGVAIAFLLPPRYDSTARLMPPDQTNPAGAAMLAALAGRAGEGLSSFAADTLGIRTSGALFVGVLSSRTVQDAVINKYDLRKVYWIKRYEDARKKLSSYTTVSEDKKSGIISITVRDRNAARAQKMTQTYIDELDRAMVGLSTSSARREREFLEQRLKTVKSELDDASSEFSRFASKNTAIDIPQQGKALMEGAARVQGELIATQSELQGLEQIYTSNNIRVRTLQARANELKGQLEKMVGTQGAEESGIYPSINKLPVLGVTYADLYRKTRIKEAVFETLTKQYELAKVQEAKEIPPVKVLDPPSYPERRSFPPRAVIIIAVVVFALLAHVGLLISREEWELTPPNNPRKQAAQRLLLAFKEMRNHSIAWTAPENGRH
jgi:uncharacterized protein involved in exopolysaccharide biosynthesis